MTCSDKQARLGVFRHWDTAFFFGRGFKYSELRYMCRQGALDSPFGLLSAHYDDETEL